MSSFFHSLFVPECPRTESTVWSHSFVACSVPVSFPITKKSTTRRVSLLPKRELHPVPPSSHPPPAKRKRSLSKVPSTNEPTKKTSIPDTLLKGMRSQIRNLWNSFTSDAAGEGGGSLLPTTSSAFHGEQWSLFLDSFPFYQPTLQYWGLPLMELDRSVSGNDTFNTVSSEYMQWLCEPSEDNPCTNPQCMYTWSLSSSQTLPAWISESEWKQKQSQSSLARFCWLDYVTNWTLCFYSVSSFLDSPSVIDLTPPAFLILPSHRAHHFDMRYGHSRPIQESILPGTLESLLSEQMQSGAHSSVVGEESPHPTLSIYNLFMLFVSYSWTHTSKITRWIKRHLDEWRHTYDSLPVESQVTLEYMDVVEGYESYLFMFLVLVFHTEALYRLVSYHTPYWKDIQPALYYLLIRKMYGPHYRWDATRDGEVCTLKEWNKEALEFAHFLTMETTPQTNLFAVRPFIHIIRMKLLSLSIRNGCMFHVSF